MPRRRSQRPVLAPAGHAAVDEARIVGQQHVGAEAQALHHAGAEAFDQAVGGAGEVADQGGAFGRLQVGLDQTGAAAVQGIARIGRGAGAVDQHHLGPMIGQHHAAEGGRADAADFNDGQAVESSAHTRH
ncbi:hypothetical protein D3C73_1239010 [compost metagenome]